jgi:5'-nucleotidase
MAGIIKYWGRQSSKDESKDFGDPAGAKILNIAHFNDVYKATEQKITVDGKEESIDVTMFATLLKGITAKWKPANDGRGKDGLIVFSGDLFSPSTESTYTKGKHMVRVLPPMVLGILTCHY